MKTLKVNKFDFPPIKLFQKGKVSISFPEEMMVEGMEENFNNVFPKLHEEGKMNVFTISSKVNDEMRKYNCADLNAYFADTQKEPAFGTFIDPMMSWPFMIFFTFVPTKRVSKTTGKEVDCVLCLFATIESNLECNAYGAVTMFPTKDNTSFDFEMAVGKDNELTLETLGDYLLFVFETYCFDKYAPSVIKQDVDIYGHQTRKLPDSEDVIANKSGKKIRCICMKS